MECLQGLKLERPAAYSIRSNLFCFDGADGTFPIEPYQVFYYFVGFKLGNGPMYCARCEATVSYDIRFIIGQGS